MRKKENLSSFSTSTTSTRQKNRDIERQSTKDAIINTNSSVVSSVTVLSEKEVVIQLIYSTDHTSNNKEISSLSRVLEYLESEENGFVLLNLTTFKCPGEKTLLNTLHLQFLHGIKSHLSFSSLPLICLLAWIVRIVCINNSSFAVFSSNIMPSLFKQNYCILEDLLVLFELEFCWTQAHVSDTPCSTCMKVSTIPLRTGIGLVDTPSVALSDVYYIPSHTMNLSSVSKIFDSRCDVKFSVFDCSKYARKTQEVVEPPLVLSPIIRELVPETIETPTTTPQTTTTTKTPHVIISEATSTTSQPPTTNTQSSPEVAIVPLPNVRPIRASAKESQVLENALKVQDPDPAESPRQPLSPPPQPPPRPQPRPHEAPTPPEAQPPFQGLTPHPPRSPSPYRDDDASAAQVNRRTKVKVGQGNGVDLRDGEAGVNVSKLNDIIVDVLKLVMVIVSFG
ncbi:Achaete-scute transcription factor-related protein [Artemisia annua]|uniref:Achaete-scute transcription factor-related protein n=1 Tax=Artemisia annua TaxID=35608 RepID=A0A2U1M448_ARTAN|nr:Achaete-scute transcription factor-related protein [Artemisia annua]